MKTCGYRYCPKTAREYHEPGLHIVLCSEHWKILIDYLKRGKE